MMTKEFIINDLATASLKISNEWDDNIGQTNLSAKSLYNLIGLKRALMNYYEQTQETVKSIMQQFDARPNAQGVLEVPEEKMEEANKKIFEFSRDKTKFDYEPICINEDDVIPPCLLEAIFDFVEFK